MLLWHRKWGFPVSRVVLTPELFALAEEQRLGPSPAQNFHSEDANWNRLTSLVDVLSLDCASYNRKHLVAGGHERLRLLQLLVVPHAVLRYWNQLVAYQVGRRAAVHQYHEHFVGVGLQTPSATARRQSRERESVAIKIEGWLLVVIGGRRASTQHSRGDVGCSRSATGVVLYARDNVRRRENSTSVRGRPSILPSPSKIYWSSACRGPEMVS